MKTFRLAGLKVQTFNDGSTYVETVDGSSAGLSDTQSAQLLAYLSAELNTAKKIRELRSQIGIHQKFLDGLKTELDGLLKGALEE